MQIEIFFLSVLLMLITIVFIPDLFPYCSCCGKYKPRLFFRICRTVKVRPGYSGNRSVCRKCSRRYDIETLADLNLLMNARRKAELRLDLTDGPVRKLPVSRSRKL